MNLRELYSLCKDALCVDDADFEAKQIVYTVCKTSANDFILNKDNAVDDECVSVCKNYVARRNLHEPLYYILGQTEFYSLPFYVGKGVLIPRQDTEVLVEKAISYLESLNLNKQTEVLDLCAGSGCIGIAIAKNYTNCHVTSIEKYDKAYDYLCKNIELNNCLNVTAIKDDALNYGGEKYQLVVSNPPYIRNDEKQDLQSEVLSEPKTALFAKENGLYFYRRIAKNFCASNTELMFETGDDQKSEVENILLDNHYTKVESFKDYNGQSRVTIGFAAVESHI